MIVVDTNVLVSLHISTAHSTLAERALRKDPDWLAPLLWRSEFRNVLATLVRAGRLTNGLAIGLVEAAEDLMNERSFEVGSVAVLQLASSSGCSAYDCEFVALAEDVGARLITLDKRIVRAFPRTAVALERFVRR